jgi:TDG/mug DNA glycosylase family protein
MEALFGIDHHLPYRERLDSLTGHHIALWDVVSACSRKGSADEQIREPAFNDIAGFLAKYPGVRLIILNGTAAGRYFLRMNLPSARENRILPSSSPANTRYTLLEKIEAWKIVLDAANGNTASGSSFHAEP